MGASSQHALNEHPTKMSGNSSTKISETDARRARFGPRELKDPRSKEYAIQTVYALRTYVQAKIADEELIGRELEAGRLHHKSLSQKDFFQVALIPSGDEAFVLDADLEC